MKPRIPFAVLLAAACAVPAAWGAAASRSRVKIAPKNGKESSWKQTSTWLDYNVIDTLTPTVLDQGDFESRSRFFSGGGLVEYGYFGVYNGLNVGASLTADGLIGSTNQTRMRDPEAQIKWRFYRGSRRIPAFAVGYDGQGYDYNQASKSYSEPRRGAFLTASSSLGVPGLEIVPSVNMTDFSGAGVAGAIAAAYEIKGIVELMSEWDDIRAASQSRFNAGLRVNITQNFEVAFSVRAIGQGGAFAGGLPRGDERVLELYYRGDLF